MKRKRSHTRYPVFSYSIITMALSACGSIPIPIVKQIESQTVVVAPEPSKPLMELGKIENSPKANSPSHAEVTLITEPTRPVMGSAAEYWREAIKNLQHGDVASARWALDQALTLRSGYQRAVDLLFQLDADPQGQLGEQYFEYRLQYGDSLSKLAATHLNDPLKFHLLARFNNIDNPSRVQVGQLIRIPGSDKKLKQQQSLELATVSDTSYLKARSFFDIGKYDDAIALLENSLDEMGLTDEESRAINRLLTNAFIQKAHKLEQQNKILSAKEVLEKASELQPGNTDIRFQLESLTARIEIDQYYQQGISASNEGREEEAFIAFDKVLEIDPDHRAAKEKRDALFITVADRLYKRALLAQRRQNLNLAVEIWDQFLAMMPDNENAQLYRAKAVKMKTNLQKFVSQ